MNENSRCNRAEICHTEILETLDKHNTLALSYTRQICICCHGLLHASACHEHCAESRCELHTTVGYELAWQALVPYNLRHKLLCCSERIIVPLTSYQLRKFENVSVTVMTQSKRLPRPQYCCSWLCRTLSAPTSSLLPHRQVHTTLSP